MKFFNKKPKNEINNTNDEFLDSLSEAVNPLVRTAYPKRSLAVDFDEQMQTKQGFVNKIISKFRNRTTPFFTVKKRRILISVCSLVLVLAISLGLFVMSNPQNGNDFDSLFVPPPVSETETINNTELATEVPTELATDTGIDAPKSTEPKKNPVDNNKTGNKKFNPNINKNKVLKPLSGVYSDNYDKVYQTLKGLYVPPPTYSSEENTWTNSSDPQFTIKAESNAPATGGGDEKADFGRTNTQVDYVDEADIIKNDGKYLYVLNGAYDEKAEKYKKFVNIIKAGSDGKMTLISKTEVNDDKFNPLEIYVLNDRLVVTGNVRVKYNQGYDDFCGHYYYGNDDSRIVIYDIKDRAKPKLVRVFDQQGGNLNTRLIGSDLYIITTYYAGDLGKLTEDNVKDFVPSTIDSKRGKKSLSPDCIALLPQIQTPSFAVMTRLDIETDSTEVLTESVMGAGNNIYANTEGIFLASYSYDKETYNVSTDILRFRLGYKNMKCDGMGNVKGTILNQFSMDEYNGNFRIVTSSWEDDTRNNCLFVLGDDMKIVGKIEKIAPGETVKSVRFMGKKAYVVTFLQIDPLFAIDLSNPAKPKILGELKIPGFSSYLHPINENLLLGIGREDNKLKFSLYDVSNPKNPVEKNKFLYGKDNEWVSSSAEYDHKAVMYDKAKGILAVPVINQWGEGNNGILLLKISESNGFKELAYITHFRSTSNKNEYINNFESIYRSTYTGNSLYTISNGMILSVDINKLVCINELILIEQNPQVGYIVTIDSKKVISPAKK